MKLRERFRRLTIWNKIGVIGAFTSIIGVMPFVVKLFVPDLQSGNVLQGSGNNVVYTGDGDVTINDVDFHIRSLGNLSDKQLAEALDRERRLVLGNHQHDDLDAAALGTINGEPRKWLANGENAGSIITSLKDTKPIREYLRRAESLYEGRWIPEPGWNGVVLGIPEPFQDEWLVTIRMTESQVIVFAITTEASGDSWRNGNKVTVTGRIEKVRYNPFIYLNQTSIQMR